jgi:cobalt/nickel transport system permease protein
MPSATPSTPSASPSPLPEETSTTPAWMLTSNIAMCPCGCIGRRTKGSFVEKTLRGGSDLLRQVMFSDDLAHRGGVLQRLDPRAKLVSLIIVLVAAGLLHHVSALLGLYAAVLVLAASSRVPLGFFIKRVWLFVPIFTLIVVLPATLSIVTDGDVVLELWTWHGEPQGLTAQGLHSAALVVSRVAVSISLVVLVTVTTPWTRLLAGLRGLGVPRMFILIIGMAYRYIFLLLESVTDMYEARKSRTLSKMKHDRTARAFVGATAGALVGKANQLSEEVHQAMVARGYRGDARTLDPLRIRRADLLATTTAVLAATLILAVDRLLGR